MNMRRLFHIFIFFVLLLGAGRAAKATDCQQLKTELSHFIDSQVTADSVAISFRWPAHLPAGPYSQVSVQWARGAQKLRGQVVIPVRVVLNGGLEKVVYVRAEIRCFDDVVVAKRNIGRHDILKDGYLALTRRETTGLREAFYRETAGLNGLRVRRLITGDRIVLSNMVETPPMVRRGSTVEVAFAHGNLTVVTRGVARQDGWEGDIIRIRMPNDRKELKGKVAGRGQVALTY